MKRLLFLTMILILLLSALTGCGGKKETPTPAAAVEGGLPVDAMAIASERGLTPDDINAALKTYMPSGKWDEYYLFLSGGHSGNLIVAGVPSMRILKNIAVFTPESWQGYGFGNEDIENMLDAGNPKGETVRMGDSHHPALSETAGDYDGQFIFINDKNSARVAVIDLRDFETKQIVKDPNIISNHGSTFVTPNTEYIIQGTQYPTPLGLRVRASIRVQRQVPRRDHDVEVRSAKRAVSTRRSPSALKCRRIGKTCVMPVSWSARAGASATRSTPSWLLAATWKACPTSRPAPASAIWTTCISSTGRRLQRWSPPARQR